MKRVTLAVCTFLALASISAWVVLADSPHFVRASASLNSAGQLVVSWKEAGLGGGQVITYVAGANQAQAIYACINNGGKHPSAANKESINGPITASGDFTAAKNGSINGSLTSGPLPSNLDCPNGQRFVLASVSYADIFVTDTNNAVTENIAGSFKACLLSGELASDPTLCP